MIVTNKGTQFKAQTYEDFLSRLGVKHLITSDEYPERMEREDDSSEESPIRVTSLSTIGWPMEPPELPPPIPSAEVLADDMATAGKLNRERWQEEKEKYFQKAKSGECRVRRK